MGIKAVDAHGAKDLMSCQAGVLRRAMGWARVEVGVVFLLSRLLQRSFSGWFAPYVGVQPAMAMQLSFITLRMVSNGLGRLEVSLPVESKCARRLCQQSAGDKTHPII